MAKDLCRQEFGLEGEFYVEAVVVYRVHFPYGCRQFSESTRVGFLERLKAAYYGAVLSLPETSPRLSRFFPGYWRPTFRKPYEHGHAPHRDYWFGYALDGINLWWAIEEVRDENGMVLFPGTARKTLSYRQRGAPYIAAGQPLPRPRYTPLSAGEFLAMSTNELHGTRLNESDSTRIVVSIRVSSEKPKFFRLVANQDYLRLGLFHPASSLDRGDFDTLWNPAEDRAHDMWGEPRESGGPVLSARTVRVDKVWPSQERIGLFDSQLLRDGGRVIVELKNRELVVFLTSRGPAGVALQCPHEGYKIADGFCDGESVHCPGHGVKFSLETGRSLCGLSLSTYRCTESDGMVFLEP